MSKQDGFSRRGILGLFGGAAAAATTGATISAGNVFDKSPVSCEPSVEVSAPQGMITSVSITNPGSGYMGTPKFSIAPNCALNRPTVKVRNV